MSDFGPSTSELIGDLFLCGLFFHWVYTRSRGFAFEQQLHTKGASPVLIRLHAGR